MCVYDLFLRVYLHGLFFVVVVVVCFCLAMALINYGGTTIEAEEAVSSSLFGTEAKIIILL